ncbi:MAG TPA: DUF3857 and transglutaminase domain-containing protein, partial [Candidatus Polarisedimenticolia bacterium]|nr:DUF3857 and transglutaminase domain-containing protein [Candidatus Polarisedimenticolia bacterium]
GSIVSKGSDFANVLTYHRRLKILTERGREAGEVRIPAGKNSRVEGIEARTIRPDGSVVPVPASEIHQRVVARTRGWNEVAHVFHFPSVEPGAILEYRYQRTVDTFVFIEPWSFTQDYPVLVSKVAQAVPWGAEYAVSCHHCPDPKPVVTPFRDGQKRGSRHAWEVRDLPARKDEPLSPPDRVTDTDLEMVLRFWAGVYWLQLDREERFFTDWESVGRFASFGYDAAAKEDLGALKEKVAGWVAGISEPEARLKAVVAGVRRSTRYLGGDEVYGLARPVGDLLRDGTADNEERAVLMAAALRLAGFPSRIALVAGRDGQPMFQNFPSLSQFSFAVTIASLPDGADLWIDPTATWAPYDFLPWRASGASGLLLDKRRKNPMVSLPTRADTGLTRFDVRVTPTTGGRATLAVDVTFIGEPAVEMRELLVPAGATEREDQVREWLETVGPSMPLTGLTIDALEEVDKPLRLHFTSEASGLTLRTDEALGVRACVFDCYDGRLPIAARREAPFYVDRGLRTMEMVTLVPPPGLTRATLPPSGDAMSAIGGYTFGCSEKDDGTVECGRALTLPRARLPVTEADAVRAMFQKVAEFDRSGVLFAAPD